MIRQKAREGGFTLLEVLVALALVALLAMALSGMVRLAVQAWERSIQRSASAEAVVRIDRTLRRQLAATVPAGALGRVAGNPPLFFGARDGFGWVARTPSDASGPGLYGQRVRLVRNGALVLESWPLDRPDRIDRAPLISTPGTRFAYFGRTTPAEPPRWQARWPAGPIPPLLVRLEPPAALRMPALVYPLR